MQCTNKGLGVSSSSVARACYDGRHGLSDVLKPRWQCQRRTQTTASMRAMWRTCVQHACVEECVASCRVLVALRAVSLTDAYIAVGCIPCSRLRKPF